MNPDLLKQKAADIMTAGAKSIRPQALASEAVRMMNTDKITNLFVVEDGKQVGGPHPTFRGSPDRHYL